MRFLCVWLCFSAAAAAQTLTPVWIELGPEGRTLARVVVETASSCPSLQADGKVLPMTPRLPVPDGFRQACEALVPASTRKLKYGGKTLRLPKTPKRVVVVGDTGCRVKGATIQDCNDPAKWPLQSVASNIERAKPDLIVDVGDYLYREGACPDAAKGCEGPHGDNWPAWNADFFSPAASALSAAPWAFSRGNHEDCSRSWRGWFYYLDPRPYTASCESYSAPYIAQSGELKIGMLDSSATREDTPDADQVKRYSSQLATFSGHALWVADHHPFWALKRSPATHRESVISQPLAAAWEQTNPSGIRFILSGHIHLFEFLSFEGDRPNQLVAGDGGTDLADSVKTDFSGETVSGAAVKSGRSLHDFGYTVLDRSKDGWKLTLKDSKAKTLITCDAPNAGSAACRAPR
jgi:hypothetical protein